MNIDPQVLQDNVIRNPNLGDYPRNCLAFLEVGAGVQRYHTRHLNKPESVGHHSHGVAMLCYMITAGTASRDLLVAAMLHDMGECFIGDIPSPVKRLLPPGLEEEEHRLVGDVLKHARPATLQQQDADLLSFCDSLHGYFKVQCERRIGNRTLDGVAHNYHGYLHQKISNRLHDSAHATMARRFLKAAQEHFNER